MTTKEQEPRVASASVTLRKPDDWIVYLRDSTIPLSCRIEFNQPVPAADTTTDGKLSLKRATSDWTRAKAVWTLAASPPLTIMEEHPEDAEIIRRLQVLAEEKSGVGQNFTRVAEASGRLYGIMRDSKLCRASPLN
ncbi:Quinate permease [Pyrenophora tritici-repentis]|nr:Quinate permease [Pyrenophora tritici-repentis]KAI2475270.1 Quinate permease [Pyrenophora tritici-repentis]